MSDSTNGSVPEKVEPKYFWPEDQGRLEAFEEIPYLKDIPSGWIRVKLSLEREPNSKGIILRGYEPWGIYRVGPAGLTIQEFTNRIKLNIAYGFVGHSLDGMDIGIFIEYPSPFGEGSWKNRTKYTLPGYQSRKESRARQYEARKMRLKNDPVWADAHRAKERLRMKMRHHDKLKASIERGSLHPWTADTIRRLNPKGD